MKLAIVLVGIVLTAFADDDAWAKVKQLKSGTEVRIFKVGDKAGVAAKFDEADDMRVVVVVKNEQKAIAKDEIEKLEARPSKGGGMRGMTRTESKTVATDPAAEAGRPKPQGSAAAPGLSSTSSGVNFESKPAFELVYRREMKFSLPKR